jgi:Matrixin.
MAMDEVVQQAFATWAPETNLTFRQVSECADINIAFIEANKSHIENFRNRTIFGYAYIPSKGRVFQFGLGLVH